MNLKISLYQIFMPKDFSENVYFRKDTIENTTGEGVMDLRNIFKVGDIVQFDAVIGPDDARCKWRYVKNTHFFTLSTDTRQTKKKHSLHNNVVPVVYNSRVPVNSQKTHICTVDVFQLKKHLIYRQLFKA